MIYSIRSGEQVCFEKGVCLLLCVKYVLGALREQSLNENLYVTHDSIDHVALYAGQFYRFSKNSV